MQRCRGRDLLPLALDATYATGAEPSGVGIYSRELIRALRLQTEFRLYYRLHRFRHALPGFPRGLLGESWMLPQHSAIFHGLNQRMPAVRFRGSACTFHDLFVLTADYSSPEFRRRFAQQAREAAQRANLLVCVSAFTASQVEGLLGVSKEQIRVVHHGVRDLPITNVPRGRVVLSTGAIQHRKNTVRLIQAFEALDSDWTLVLAGAPSGYGAQEALDTIARSPARERIRLTGYVSDAELAAWYSRASIFAFPSLDEGFGMPALEAMAAGVPVVSSNRSALPEVCGGAAIYVDPFRTEELTEALRRVAADEDLRLTLAGAGRQQAARFTWARAAEQTMACYRELGLL